VGEAQHNDLGGTMNNRISGTHSTRWQRALLGGSTVAIVVLLAACGGSPGKSSTAAPARGQSASGLSASGQNVNSLAKFCSDDTNETALENQIGGTPDLADPATHALLVQDLNDLKAMVGEAPSAIKHDLETMESVTATAAAGKDPQGESLYNEYTTDIDNVNNWVTANCPATSGNGNSSSASGTSSSGGTSASSTGSSSGSGGSGGSTDQLISTCVSDFQSGNWGATDSTDPTPFCNCAINGWLTTSSPEDIANVMQMSMSDDSGTYPPGLSQSNCSSSDPTIDPSTGSPWSS
jgi:hypothetical protein